MRGPSCWPFAAVPVSLSLLSADALPAYVGLGPGQELIPYFLALLAWVGAAVGAILLWPVSALLRRLRRARGDRKPELKNDPNTVRLPDSPGEAGPQTVPQRD